MNIESRMTRHVFCCAPDDTLEQAARVMWEGDCGWLPVLDADGALVGVITDRDVCMAAYTRGTRLKDEVVGTVMARRVVMARPDDRLVDLEHLMKVTQLRRIPVLDADDRLVGIVTLSDLAREEAAHGQRGARDVTGAAATLSVITEPRHTALPAA